MKIFHTWTVGKETYLYLYSLSEPDPKKLATLRLDIATSSCEIVIYKSACSPSGCGTGTLQVSAVTDFIQDGDRATRIVTNGVKSDMAVGWTAYNPPDIEVSARGKSFFVSSGWLVILPGEDHLVLNIKNPQLQTLSDKRLTVNPPSSYIVYKGGKVNYSKNPHIRTYSYGLGLIRFFLSKCNIGEV